MMMSYISKVHKWFKAGEDNRTNVSFWIANEMLYLAFNELSAQLNLFRSTNPNVRVMVYIRRKFHETFESHLEVLEKPEIQYIRGTYSTFYLAQLGSALNELYMTMHEDNRIVQAIFCCRYAVYVYMKGQESAPTDVIWVVSGMVSTVDPAILHLETPSDAH